MTKKEYILKLLDALMGYRPLARGLKILVEGNALDDKTIDTLIDIFSQTINEINDSTLKEKLEKSKGYLTQLQQTEGQEKEKETVELQKLDKILENF